MSSSKGGEGAGGSPIAAILSVNVKFGGRSIPVSLTSESTVKDLKSLLQPLTNVLPRGQKLIYKGKVLEDSKSLKSSAITNGAKLMLMASQGLHQGDGPITKAKAKSKDDEEAFTPSSTIDHHHKTTVLVVDKTQSQRWKLTGVISLSESHLKVIPDDVWACGSSVRFLDLSKNFIQEVPAKICSLNFVQKLLLNANCIVDEHFNWEGVTSLKSLTVLSLSQNHLTTIPSSMGSLTSLRELHVANNKLTSLPIEIGLLSRLQILQANNNRISGVPSSIGNCSSLIEINLSSNLLLGLPETLGCLQNLKHVAADDDDVTIVHVSNQILRSEDNEALHLRNNGLKTLPCTLFKHCSRLSTLDLHGTEITMDFLRQFEGWKDFDERRRSKLQKQLDFSVGVPEGFDEGADKE